MHLVLNHTVGCFHEMFFPSERGNPKFPHYIVFLSDAFWRILKEVKVEWKKVTFCQGFLGITILHKVFEGT